MSFLTGARAVRVFLCFAFAYLLSYAFRSVNAVIAPALQDDLGLSNSELGLLSSAYFVSIAALQLPIGIWLDRYGPRRTEAGLLLFAAVGAAIFAMSSSLTGLWIGRALIGMGVAACLMASYKAYRQWFAPDQQSRLASLMLVAGTAGALSSTVPVSAAMSVIGWRGVFWVMSGLIVLATLAIFFLLKKVEAAHARRAPQASGTQSMRALFRGYGDVFGNPYFRRMAVLGAFNNGSATALQTLWAGPWMMTVLGMNKAQTANILFLYNLCMMLGYLSLSWWAPRRVSHDGSRGLSTTRAITCGLLGMVFAQVAILSCPPTSWAWALWIVLAFFVTVSTLIQSSVSLSFPTALAGRAASAYNFMVFVGAFIIQWGMGVLIDVFQSLGASPPQAMRAAFAICVGCQTLGLLAFSMNRAQPARVPDFGL